MNFAAPRSCRTRRMEEAPNRLSAILAALLCLVASTAAAQDPSIPGDPRAGQDLYERHCAVCHGLDGEGGGPMAPVLIVQPSDLTTMTERHDRFPVTRIVTRIDGRDPLVAHGSSMPVWGDFFEGEDVSLKTETGQPMLTSQPIVDLVSYLEEIQQETR